MAPRTKKVTSASSPSAVDAIEPPAPKRARKPSAKKSASLVVSDEDTAAAPCVFHFRHILNPYLIVGNKTSYSFSKEEKDRCQGRSEVGSLLCFVYQALILFYFYLLQIEGSSSRRYYFW